MLQGQLWLASQCVSHRGALPRCVACRTEVHHLNPEMGYTNMQGRSLQRRVAVRLNN